MTDLFGSTKTKEPIHVNIYADEIQAKKCPLSKDAWHYIGLIVEDLAHPLLKDIINERYRHNNDSTSPYFEKNNKSLHWSEISTADHKNICKRWFNYILNPEKSNKSVYSYILGLNDSRLNRDEFDTKDKFNSKYNRFFSTAVLYALKTFYSGRDVIVDNIYHEMGPQQGSHYFPWHCIYKLGNKDNISFRCDKIIFLPKDHKKCDKSNIVQLCDCLM